MNRTTSNLEHFLNGWAFLINVFFLLAPLSLNVLFIKTIMKMNKRYSIYKTKALLYNLIYIIKQDHPFKVNNIINIIQIIVIVDRLSLNSVIRMLAPSLLLIIITIKSIILIAITT
jgi:hypothetical protein